MPGDDMLKVTVEVGQLRESPAGAHLVVRAAEQYWVPLSARDLEAGGAQGEASMRLHQVLNKLVGPLS